MPHTRTHREPASPEARAHCERSSPATSKATDCWDSPPPPSQGNIKTTVPQALLYHLMLFLLPATARTRGAHDMIQHGVGNQMCDLPCVDINVCFGTPLFLWNALDRARMGRPRHRRTRSTTVTTTRQSTTVSRGTPRGLRHWTVATSTGICLRCRNGPANP